MRRFLQTLCLCWALALTNAAPAHHEGLVAEAAQEDKTQEGVLDRCDGVEFDAITPDEKGNTFFFKGDQLWKGFHGPAQPSNESFKELDKYLHLGHVDAAFRMHRKDTPQDHDHTYLFLDDMVFSYFNQVLEEGYPKDIQQDFPGIPGHLDAAVECPKGECSSDSVLFFKGGKVYNYDIPAKAVKERLWAHLPNCTSAFRWLEHYYCFHGNNFTRFHPVTGEVAAGNYPKDARRYFMKCTDHPGHARGSMLPKCSEISLNAISSDDAGKTYAFMGPHFLRLDSHRDGRHTFPITRNWKEVNTSTVDAVFSHRDRMYIIVGDQVFIYKSGAHYTLIEGYPKTLKEELAIKGHVDAAFMCAGDNTVHIIQGFPWDRTGRQMVDVDLSATPRVVSSRTPLPNRGISAALCGPEGVRLFAGSKFYDYGSVWQLEFNNEPRPQNITSEMLGCED